MTYRGTFKNGVVVFDAPTALKDGTPVRVEPLPVEQTPVSPSMPHFRPVGSWEGPPGELDRLLSDVQAMRDADLDMERDAWE